MGLQLLDDNYLSLGEPFVNVCDRMFSDWKVSLAFDRVK